MSFVTKPGPANAELSFNSIAALLQACHTIHHCSDEQLLHLLAEQLPGVLPAEARQCLPTLRLLLHSGAYLRQQLQSEAAGGGLYS